MRLKIDLFIHGSGDDQIGDKLDQILTTLKCMETKIMASLDEALAKVTEQGTRLDSIDTLMDSIEQQLADALSGTTLPAAVQAKVDAVFEGLKANDAKIDEALNTNVPPPAA